MLLALAPLVAPDHIVVTLTELLIFALFAASLHFMMGPGGMASFGHAAYFGLGAYGAALAVKWLGAPMEPALLFAPFLAGIAGVVFGWFCVRLSGVYLAMLTLAFAQISWATAFQWVELTGGDNGILGVWPAAWAAPKLAYYYLTLTVCALAILALRLTIFSPLGYALRAARDNPLRAEAVGLDVMRIQWVAFTVAAFAAGIAGGLFAFFKGSVFPTYMAIPRSVDALLMVLLGGVQTISGPVVGAFAYAGLSEQLMKATMYWRFGLGLSIVLLVVLFPRGLVGASLLLRERLGKAGNGCRCSPRTGGQPVSAVVERREGGLDGAPAPVLVVRDLQKVLRRRACGRRRVVLGPGRHHAGADRAQRRRQDDLLQHAQRPAQARWWAGRPGGQADHRHAAAGGLAHGRRPHLPDHRDLHLDDGARERPDGADFSRRRHLESVRTRPRQASGGGRCLARAGRHGRPGGARLRRARLWRSEAGRARRSRSPTSRNCC